MKTTTDTGRHESKKHVRTRQRLCVDRGRRAGVARRWERRDVVRRARCRGKSSKRLSGIVVTGRSREDDDEEDARWETARETSDDGRETLTLTSMVWGVPLRSRASRGTERGVDEGEGGDAWRRRSAAERTTPSARPRVWTVTSRSFRAVAERADRRCVMYVDGFYEWRTEGPRGRGVKQPYLVRRSDGGDRRLAGVFERKKSVAADEEKVDLTNEEAVIVTMSSAHGDLEWLHDRQPMVLSTDEDFGVDVRRLGGEASARTAKDLARGIRVASGDDTDECRGLFRRRRAEKGETRRREGCGLHRVHVREAAKDLP